MRLHGPPSGLVNYFTFALLTRVSKFQWTRSVVCGRSLIFKRLLSANVGNRSCRP